MLLLSHNVLNHHGHGVNPGDHHAQRHHVLDHEQEAEKRSRWTQTISISTTFYPEGLELSEIYGGPRGYPPWFNLRLESLRHQETFVLKNGMSSGLRLNHSDTS